MNLQQPVNRAEVRDTTSYWEAGDSRAIEDAAVGEALRRIPTSAGGGRMRTCLFGPNAWPGRFWDGSIRATIQANNIPEWAIPEYAATLAGVTVNPAPRAGCDACSATRAAGVFPTPEYRGSRMAGILAGVRFDPPNLRETASFSDRGARRAGATAETRAPRGAG